MKHLLFLSLILFAASTLADTPPDAKTSSQEKPQVEVVFVLDSTGSMGGLIEGAKQTIWAIANEIIQQEPTPEVRMGLLTYRDRGDEYVTKMFNITDDIDAIYGHLRTIRAAGGGDGPESVNQALDEAVNQMEWSLKEQNTYRVIFLVGDFPPHMDYQDDVKYPVTCEKAATNGIIINTIQCGSESTCTPIWKDIARRSEGEFVQMAQEGNVRVLETPFDKEIAEETTKLNATVIRYGSARQRAEVDDKLIVQGAMGAAMNASRSAFNMGTGGRAIQGRGDLLYDANLDAKLLEKEEELPEELQKMSVEDREKFIKEKQEERDAINKKIGELSAKRTEWLKTEGEKKRLEVAKNAPSFDKSVSEMIQRQMGKMTGK